MTKAVNFAGLEPKMTKILLTNIFLFPTPKVTPKVKNLSDEKKAEISKLEKASEISVEESYVGILGA